MEHVIRQKRTMLIIGSDEADVRHFLATQRAWRVSPMKWPDGERFDVTGCTPNRIPEGEFDVVIVTNPAIGDAVSHTAEGADWTWLEPLDDAPADMPAPRSIVRMVNAKARLSPECAAKYAAIAEAAAGVERAEQERGRRACAIVESILPGRNAWIGSQGEIIVEAADSDAVVTFDALAKVAGALHTRAINLHRVEGWPGTDVTPGDADTMQIRITGWSLDEPAVPIEDAPREVAP